MFWRHNIEFQLLLLRFLCFLNISFLSVCLFVIYYIIVHNFFLYVSTLSFSVSLTFCSSLSLASLRSAVLSVGMLFAGLLFHIRISSRSRSGRGIFCPLLSGARPSRPLVCLGGHSLFSCLVEVPALNVFGLCPV